MKGRLLTFMAGLVVREVISAWFDYTKGVYQLPGAASVVITVAIAFALAAAVHIVVRLSAAAHTDPDTAFVGWVRFLLWVLLACAALAMVAWEPYAGAPLLALIMFAALVARRMARLEDSLAAEQVQAMPTVPQQHRRAARARYANVEDRGTADRPVGPSRAGLDAEPRAARTERALAATDVFDVYGRVTGQ